jgi:hypothetical protein
MEYTQLDTAQKQQLLQGRLRQLEADHYQRTLDQAAVKGRKKADQEKRSEIQAELDELDSQHAQLTVEMKALDKEASNG